MSTYEVLQVVQPVVYGLLAALTVVLWIRNRDGPSAWLAVTFTTLGAVLLLAQLVPEQPSGAERALQHALAVGVILFPYLLHRFSASMLRSPRWLEAAALVLTVSAIGLALSIPEYPEPGEPRTGAAGTLVALLVVQWLVLLGAVAVRFWRAGDDQHAVARRRMRTLSAAAVVLAVALLIAGVAGPTDSPGVDDIATQVLSIVSAPLFFLGFAPPAGVRMAWRRTEELNLDAVELALLGDLTEHEAASLLVPAVARLVGGGAMVVLDDGETVISEGIDAETQKALLGERSTEAHTDPNLITVPMRLGRLVIQGTSCTPFFGRDEVALARRLAARADLALDRVRSSQIVRQQAALLDLAADGIFVRTFDGTIQYWNKGAERLYGWTATEAIGRVSQELLGTRVPTFDDIAGELLEHGVWEGRLVQTRKDGETLVVDSRWTLQREPEPLVLEINTDVSQRVREEELRERFIANAAHELRTPLTTLIGFAQVLATSKRSEEQTAIARDAVSRSALRLRTLVDNLLDLTRLQSDDVGGEHAESADVESLFRGVVETVEVPADKTVRIDVEQGLEVRTVSVLLERVITNLLTNAFRYGGAEVVLTGRRDGATAVLAVTDDGPGVEPALRDRLFDAFARGARSSAVGGSGLGLAIARSAVEQLGGTIRYEDAEPSGARFVLELPMAQAG